jgi:Putative zinc-finger
MNCLEIREHLAEFALGTLPPAEARRIERHLEWCEGCRKEATELREGATPMALSLPAVEPPPRLEERVVTRILAAAGRWRTASRRGVRALVASTAAAVILAVGALGWAIAERQNVGAVRAQAADQLAEVRQLVGALRDVGATPFQATLHSTDANSQSSGSVTVYSALGVKDFVLAQVVLVGHQSPPYSFELTDGRGDVLSGGPLVKTDNGTWLFYDQTGRNLSRGVTVLVLDRSNTAVLTGTLSPATEK